MTANLKELKLRPGLLIELGQLGYETTDDLNRLSSADLLRIPGMGGRDWRTIAHAMGRAPFSKRVRR